MSVREPWGILSDYYGGIVVILGFLREFLSNWSRDVKSAGHMTLYCDISPNNVSAASTVA